MYGKLHILTEHMHRVKTASLSNLEHLPFIAVLLILYIVLYPYVLLDFGTNSYEHADNADGVLLVLANYPNILDLRTQCDEKPSLMQH